MSGQAPTRRAEQRSLRVPSEPAGKALRLWVLICALLVAQSFAAWLLPSPALAAKRVALVIGNSAYKNTGELLNPKNDAADMAAVLLSLDFTVVQGFDLDKVGMDAKVREFADALSGADTGLFYYAGHGLQVADVNYLVPVDAKLTTASALDFQMLRFDLIQRTMERESPSNILFLDACRDNPLARDLARAMGTRSAQIGRGLAAAEAGVGTLISFSTQPGNVALDGNGRNSPFAAALVQNIAKTNAPLSDLLIAVRNDVVRETNGKQVPWEHSALTGQFYFKPISPGGDAPAGSPVALASPLPSNAAAEEWASVDKTSAIELEIFIRRHGNSAQGAYAAARLAALDREKKDREETAKKAEQIAKAAPEPLTEAQREGENFMERQRKWEENRRKGLEMMRDENSRDRSSGGSSSSSGQTDAAALFSEAYSHDEGVGKPKNPAEAARLYRQAIDGGSVEAMVNLALLYRDGRGVRRNDTEAIKLLRKATDLGDKDAMTNLGHMYENGRGVGKSLAAATRLYQQAAGLGEPTAMRNLAVFYDEGRGVGKDEVEAANWLFSAISKGETTAIKDMTSNPDAWAIGTRRELQRRLQQEGLYSGPIDGRFGSAHRQAVQSLAARTN